MKAFAEGSSNPSALDGAMHCVGALQGSLQTGKVAEQYAQQGDHCSKVQHFSKVL
jgi:hypothetical protein